MKRIISKNMIGKCFQNNKKKIKRFVRHIKNKIRKVKSELKFLKDLKKASGKVFIIGTPTHTNIGDSAIVIAEQELIKNYKLKVKEITTDEYNLFQKYIDVIIKRSSIPICLHGGGNMGNQWIEEEYFRRNLIKKFKSRHMIVFPQTVFYTNDDFGRKEQEKSIGIYNEKKNLTIVAREEISYNLLKKIYPKTNVLLTPDIVLSIDSKIFNIEKTQREGVLFIIREDPERSMSDDSRFQLFEFVKSINISYTLSDMHADKEITKSNRFEIVREKLKEFARAKLVITDRLHGMIFSAITETPCIVFSNYNHKVKGTYDWISYLPYIKYVDTVEEAKNFIPVLLNMEDCHYDNTPLKPYFDQLKRIID